MLHTVRRAALTAAAALLAALLPPAPAGASTSVGGGVVGTTGYYDYAPSVIQSGQVQDFWWCGDLPGHTTDTILHEQYNFTGGVHVTIPEHAVLTEGATGAWDDALICNPDVVEGSFPNVLGDGVTYTYALYYVGYGNAHTADNQIGVAFSTDGEHWVKYSQPVITSPYSGVYYGAAQPNASYVAGTLTLVYEYQEGPNQHLVATSSDGVHFTAAGTVTTAGLRRARPSWAGAPRVGGTGEPLSTSTWGGAAYDTADGRWYVAVNDDPTRPAATTGGVAERGQQGVTLYATSSLLSGAWQELDTIDTNLTGWEANFLAGILRDPAGTVYTPGLPGVELYASTSMPRPAYNASGAQLGGSGGFNQWDIAWSVWRPGQPWRTLARVDYAGGHHEITTGWWDSAVYHLESVNLGKLAEAPTGGASVPLYGCKAGATDYFISLGSGCENQYSLGLEGYAYATSAPDRLPLYRCVTSAGHFVSTDPACEGTSTEGLLGYSAT